MPDELELQLEAEQEDQQILLWRLEQFQRLGFGADAAVAMAEARVDVGQARTLIARGCSAEVAVRILL